MQRPRFMRTLFIHIDVEFSTQSIYGLQICTRFTNNLSVVLKIYVI